MSTEERVSESNDLSDTYRDRLAEALAAAMRSRSGNVAVNEVGLWAAAVQYADAVLAVPNLEVERLTEENTRLAAKITEWEQYESDVLRVLNAKSEALARAEDAIGQVRVTAAALRQMAIAALDDGHAGLSDDHYAGVERAVDAILAALNPAGGSEKKEDPNAV